jgi:acyl-CoA synthetase (AMP-forming)/AMP-acid ligase II
MRVPLTTLDFIDRAELVYGDRVGIIDEPVQPASSLGELTYREVARRARAIAAGLDALGVGEGERVAVVSHNSARLLELLYGVPSFGRVLVPINFRLSAAEFEYIVEHCGARVLLADPEIEKQLTGITGPRRFLIGDEYESELLRYDAEPRPWSEPDEDATATINYTSGTTARPKGVQMTHRNIWTNAVTFGMHMQVSDRDVYLHTLPMFHCNGWGMPYATAGLGATQVPLRKVDGAEILRRVERHGVHRRRRRGTPLAHHRPDRGGARLGVQPDLRPHRDRAPADGQPPARRVRPPVPAGPGEGAVPGRRAGARHPAQHQRVRRAAGPGQHRDGRLLGEPGGLRGGAGRGLVPHR